MRRCCSPKIGLPQIPTSDHRETGEDLALLQSQNRASTNSDFAGSLRKLGKALVAIPKSGFHKFRRRLLRQSSGHGLLVAIPKSGFHKFRLVAIPVAPYFCVLLQSQNRASTNSDRLSHPGRGTCIVGVAIPKSGFHKFRPGHVSSPRRPHTRCNPKIGLPQIPTDV